MTRRRALLASALSLPAWPLSASTVAAPVASANAAATSDTERVLRYAMPAAETGFDPLQISDLYSITITGHIFESLYDYDHLARPWKLVPRLALELPEVADEFRSFTVRLRPGVLFQDDPAFGGQPRELTADDVVYTFKRVYDPAVQSPSQPSLEEQGLIGLRELREAALKNKQPFDYQAPVDGLQALDRYTVRFKLRETRPRFVATLAGSAIMAREVVETYGDRIMEHPVGTGPFVLTQWRRSSRIVLSRNPRDRERYYDAQPAPDDAEGQALLARFKGRRLPMLDRVEVSIIEEAQPRWLSFLNGEQDLLQIVPPDFIGQAIPGGELAPHLARRGVRKYRIPASDIYYMVFNMEHPMVGGLEPAQVALRRAISLGHDIQREITLARRGEAIAAQQLTTPGTTGFDPTLRTEAGVYSPNRARALLDLYGYTDRNGDGWRERPDGSPLTLELLAQSDQTSRQLDEVFKKSMDAIGVRVELKVGQWAENLKATRAGRYMLWRVGSSAGSPDGQGALERAYSGSIGKGNLARFKLPAFDAVYDRMQALPDGPERLALFRQATQLAVAYMPYRMSAHRIVCDLAHAPVAGYRRPLFWVNWWEYVDVPPRPAAPR
jgi:ABC-type transport system substrate-binding protein